MDGTLFDMLARHRSAIRTRRESVKAVAVAGLGLGLAGLGLDGAEARKKKRRKKRCKKLGQGCTPGGKRKCCGSLLCEVREGNSQADCCLGFNAVCNVAEDCCEGACTSLLPGQSKKCTVSLPSPKP